MEGPLSDPRLLADGLRFAEAPRWHEDRLWFSDVHDYKLKTVALDGVVEVVAEVPTRPSGLGFLPDGSLLMATALDQRLWIVRAGEAPVDVADLAELAQGMLNDMVVDGHGRAFVGDTGFNMAAGGAPRPGRVLVWAQGEAPKVAAEDVVFPNGCVVTPDGGHLLICETMAARISRFAIAADGTLRDRELFCDLGTPPDGLCLDAEGGVWVGLPHDGRFVHVGADGRVDAEIAAAAPFAVACALGGLDRRTLFLCSADTDLQRLGQGDTEGRIDVVEVDVPGAGWP
jgi:sugar lactone lactonase YvrE